MFRAGQFLVEPSEFLGWFTGLGIGAVALMLFTLSRLRIFLLPLSHDITSEKYRLGLAIGGGMSIVSTFLLTAISLMFLETVLEFTGAEIIPDRAKAAGIYQNHDSSKYPNAGEIHVVAKGLGGAAKSKPGLVAIVVVILLLIVGAGYAFATLNLGFLGSFAAMSAGVGLPEELTKAFAGLLILYTLFDTKTLSVAQFQRSVLVAFAISGLGFGAGEALKYFGAYSKGDAGAFIFGVRAVWCVTLHGAWTLIVGAILTSFLPRDPKLLENHKADTFFALLMASIPTAIAHGLYNACCNHSEILPWIVGGLSLFVAFGVVQAFLEKENEQQKEKEQPKPVIDFICPSCGLTLHVKVELAGKTGKCPGCGQWMIVPEPAAIVDPGEDRTLPPQTQVGTEFNLAHVAAVIGITVPRFWRETPFQTKKLVAIWIGLSVFVFAMILFHRGGNQTVDPSGIRPAAREVFDRMLQDLPPPPKVTYLP